jgi:hypothetical protein
MKKRCLPLIVVLFGPWVFTLQLMAQDRQDNDAWYLTTGLYFWNTTTKGDFTLRGVDYDAGYVFENMSNFKNGSLNLYIETGKNNMAGLTRVRYQHFFTDETSEEFSANVLLFELAGGYYISPDLLVFAGIRYHNFSGELTPLTETYSSGSVGWVEPMLGARYSYLFLKNLGVRIRADLGGFGIGTRFSWQVNPALFYQIRRFNMELGYNFMDVKYSEGTGNDEFKYDALTQGFWIGFSYRFTW